MAWVKVPAEHHALFLAALPRDPRVSSIKMFGGLAGMANGRMFSGLFARSIIARLSPEDRAAALALDGTEVFDPMGNGRVMSDTVLLPESVMDDDGEMRAWIRRGLDYALTLPPKTKKGKAKPAKPVKQAKPVKKPKSAAKAKAKPVKKAKAKAKARPARRRAR